MPERKTVGEMLGEFLREAAVLVAVFLPLDRMLVNEPLTVWTWALILGLSGALLVLGMLLERWRD